MGDDTPPPHRQQPAPGPGEGERSAPPPPGPDGRAGVHGFDAAERRIRAVAHDFNHFLTAIVGSLQLALEELPRDAGVADDLELALDSARRGAALIRELLEPTARRDEGSAALDLAATIRDAGGVLDRVAGGRIRLELDLPDHPVPVRLARSDAERVLLNLVVNARDAIEEAGEIAVAMRVQDGGRDGEAVIEVSDDGVGIAEQEREAVFDRAFTTKDSGSGLGLAIVRSVTEEAGGSVEVESGVGGGTTFRVRLPLADPGYVRTEETHPGEAGAEPGARVLVATDDPGERRILAGALRRCGYRPVAESTAGARELLDAADDPPRLLVTTVAPADATGFRLADAFRRGTEDPGVVFVTADPVRSLPERPPCPSGLEAFLERPFSVGELLSAVRRVTEGPEPAADGARDSA